MRHGTIKIEAPALEPLEFEPLEFTLPWQRPEFWQELQSKQERSKKNLHLNKGRTKENLRLNSEGTPIKSKLTR